MLVVAFVLPLPGCNTVYSAGESMFYYCGDPEIQRGQQGSTPKAKDAEISEQYPQVYYPQVEVLEQATQGNGKITISGGVQEKGSCGTEGHG